MSRLYTLPRTPPLATGIEVCAESAALEAGTLEATLDTLTRQLAETAIARDQAGGHAARERELIRASGLLALSIPRTHGGLGGSGATFQRSVRRLAEVDSALAHVYAFHHLQMASVALYATPAQQQHWWGETVRERLFWGNALNPLDKRAAVTPVAGGWWLDGPKSFCSGSVGSDRLVVSGWHAPTQSLLVAAVPTAREGITVQADWDAFGQRQTDSGSIQFDRVFIADDEVMVAPAATYTPRATLRTLVSQLIMTNLYAGIAVGAFEAGRRYTREQSRPWPAAGVAAATDDPYVQHRYADLWLQVKPAVALADAAAARLDAALHTGESLTATERGEVAIEIAEAKVLAHRAALAVSSQFFELTGARSTSQRHGLDRYWRNARVHTLHDPVDYKLRDIGRYLLDGRVPEPGPYA